jgi:hypothetical protein
MQSEPITTRRSATFLPLPICSASFFYMTTVVGSFQPPLRRVPLWHPSTRCWRRTRTNVARSRACVFGRSLAGIAGSNPAGGMNVFNACCVLSGRGLCSRPITCPETPTEYVCVSYCVTRCSSNPLHLPQLVDSRGLDLKK